MSVIRASTTETIETPDAPCFAILIRPLTEGDYFQGCLTVICFGVFLVGAIAIGISLGSHRFLSSFTGSVDGEAAGGQIRIFGIIAVMVSVAIYPWMRHVQKSSERNFLTEPQPYHGLLASDRSLSWGNCSLKHLQQHNENPPRMSVAFADTSGLVTTPCDEQHKLRLIIGIYADFSNALGIKFGFREILLANGTTVVSSVDLNTKGNLCVISNGISYPQIHGITLFSPAECMVTLSRIGESLPSILKEHLQVEVQFLTPNTPYKRPNAGEQLAKGFAFGLAGALMDYLNDGDIQRIEERYRKTLRQFITDSRFRNSKSGDELCALAKQHGWKLTII